MSTDPNLAAASGAQTGDPGTAAANANLSGTNPGAASGGTPAKEPTADPQLLSKMFSNGLQERETRLMRGLEKEIPAEFLVAGDLDATIANLVKLTKAPGSTASDGSAQAPDEKTAAINAQIDGFKAQLSVKDQQLATYKGQLDQKDQQLEAYIAVSEARSAFAGKTAEQALDDAVMLFLQSHKIKQLADGQIRVYYSNGQIAFNERGEHMTPKEAAGIWLKERPFLAAPTAQVGAIAQGQVAAGMRTVRKEDVAAGKISPEELSKGLTSGTLVIID